MIIINERITPNILTAVNATVNHLTRNKEKCSIINFENFCEGLWREETGCDGTTSHDFEKFDTYVDKRQQFNPNYFLSKLVDKINNIYKVRGLDYVFILGMIPETLDDFLDIMSKAQSDTLFIDFQDMTMDGSPTDHFQTYINALSNF